MKSLSITLLFICSQLTLIAVENSDSTFMVDNFIKYEYKIPMRDGAKLFTTVYIPIDTTKEYPIIFSRTPYGVGSGLEKKDYKWKDMVWYKELLMNGYIWVYQDVRGRFLSEGTWTNMTPYIFNKKDKTQTDESSDAWDTVDWLIKNLNHHNGKVGGVGISYRGTYAIQTAIDAHPAVKCVSPQAPIADFFFDDFHHNGAMWLSYFNGFPIFGTFRDSLAITKDKWWHYNNTHEFTDLSEQLKPFISLQQMGEKYGYDTSNFLWREMIEHPNYDEFWKIRSTLPSLKNIKPAVMTVGGWYDGEDLFGSYNTFNAIEKQSPETDNFLVSGPWIHGGWARTDSRMLGDIYFGEGIEDYYRDSISKPFFDYYLKGIGELNLPKALCFETGTQEWRRFEQWPPKNAEISRVYLNHTGLLSGELAPSLDNYREFVSDPTNPVPYTQIKNLDYAKAYMTEDQRFVSDRLDVLSYQSEPFNSEVTIAGDIDVELIVSTTGSDADWIVKVIDVYPDTAKNHPYVKEGVRLAGYQRMIRSEVMRGRYRNSMEQPEPFISGKITTVKFKLQDLLHTFKQGHRLMIQVQSSWYPLCDVNPQKFVDNIYLAKPEDFQKATHRIYAGSFIDFKLLK